LAQFIYGRRRVQLRAKHSKRSKPRCTLINTGELRNGSCEEDSSCFVGLVDRIAWPKRSVATWGHGALRQLSVHGVSLPWIVPRKLLEQPITFIPHFAPLRVGAEELWQLGSFVTRRKSSAL